MAQLQITVDDGPQPVHEALDPILNELAHRQIRGAFFCLGVEVHADAAAANKILNQHHTLGNHSWDHLEPHTSNYSDAQIKAQFKQTHDEMLAATQMTVKHWRAPRLEDIARLTTLLTTGPGALYTLSHCDVHADSKDSQGVTTAAGMLAAIRADIAAAPQRPTFRLLFHVKSTTAAALPAVLNGLVGDGHTPVNFSQTT